MGMKKVLRKLIREFIQEMELDEDYPASFSMETFKSLGSHAGRNRYAAEHLKRIGSGSSRIVYKIDDEKVLKLAKNDKGISQNETEIQWGNERYFSSILAQTIDSDDKGLWVEMELARKISRPEFKKLVGFDINDVEMYMRSTAERNKGRKSAFGLDPELEERMDDNEFIASIVDFMLNADSLAGDLGSISSYGVVQREGSDSVVLIDYGITEDIYKSQYVKKPARMYEGENSLDEHEERLFSWKTDIEKVARQLKVELTNFIGGGLWGIAYEIPGNKVLKITQDQSEVNTAKHLIGKENKYLANIYKIYSIKGNKEKKVIIQEKLEQLDNYTNKAVDLFGKYFNESNFRGMTWAQMLSEGWNEEFDGFLKSNGKEGSIAEEIYSALLQIYDEAANMNIFLADIHKENLGLKNGDLAMFDIS